MFYGKIAHAAFRIILLVALCATLAPGASPTALARPTPQALQFTRQSVAQAEQGRAEQSARAAVDASPLFDAWRAAGSPADSRGFSDYAAAEAAQQAAARHSPALSSPAPAQFVGEVRGSVTVANGTTPSGVVFLVYYDSTSGYIPVDLDDLSDGPNYVLGVPVGIDGPSLDPRYEVWYFNFSFTSDELDTNKLYKVYGPYVRSAPAGLFVIAPSFDISNVALGAPGSYAREVISAYDPVTESGTPVNFSWEIRPDQPGLGPNEYYEVCIYDPLVLEPESDDPVILCSQIVDGQGALDPATLGRSSFAAYTSSFPADYPFTYGQPYYWFVRVYQNDESGNLISDGGTSFYENTIIFLDQPEALPPPPAEPSGGFGGSGEQKPWTVLVYMAADNELGDLNRLPNPESNIKRQWESLAGIAPNYAATITVVTYTDFYNDGSTQICNVSVSPALCQERGEQNSSDPAELQNFVGNALSSYPSKRSMLIFATHGHGVVGVGFDQSVADDAAVMTPNQVRQALTDAGVGVSLPKLDIIFYNACLMATLEVAADSAPFANYLVASSNRLWVLNIYQELLDTLVAQVDAPAEVTKGIVSAYTNRVASKVPGGVYSNLAAFDLAKVGPLVTAVSELGTALDGALAANGATNRPLINAARSAAQVYDSSGNNLLDATYDADGNTVAREEDAFVDVRHFAQLVGPSSLPQPVKDAAQAVITAANDGLIVASEQRSGPNGPGGESLAMDNASGLGFYFPNGSAAGRQATYNQAYLFDRNFETYNAASSWDNFLRTYINATVGQAPGSIGRRGDPIGGNVISFATYIPMVRR
jgi:Clostripain family